jgi:hypothetical protein
MAIIGFTPLPRPIPGVFFLFGYTVIYLRLNNEPSYYYAFRAPCDVSNSIKQYPRDYLVNLSFLIVMVTIFPHSLKNSVISVSSAEK